MILSSVAVSATASTLPVTPTLMATLNETRKMDVHAIVEMATVGIWLVGR
jgi:hypothetical protein